MHRDFITEKICVICGKEHDESIYNTLSETLKDVPWAYGAVYGFEATTVCSHECYVNWKKGRALITSINFIKNLSLTSFDDIQKVLRLPEEGGYAQQKIDKRVTGFPWLNTLDVENIKKLGQLLGRQNL